MAPRVRVSAETRQENRAVEQGMSGHHPTIHSHQARGTKKPYPGNTPTRRSNEPTVPDQSRTSQPQPPNDDSLAWELAAAMRPYLNSHDAHRIYIAIGIGETFEAIDMLITLSARDRIALGEDVVAAVHNWLDCYQGQDAEPRLRQLVSVVGTYTSKQISAATAAPSHLSLSSHYRCPRSG